MTYGYFVFTRNGPCYEDISGILYHVGRNRCTLYRTRNKARNAIRRSERYARNVLRVTDKNSIWFNHEIGQIDAVIE